TLEHVAMDYESLKELYRVLKLDGLLILTYLPNRWSFREWLRRVRGQDYHRRRYGLNEARRLLQRCRLDPIGARRQCVAFERFAGAGVISSTFCRPARKVHTM